ncbi:NmrA family transcriptional regulator, partial [Escherichia coli]|nr:NmrA family transcriptional regulator [Escherichia coli]
TAKPILIVGGTGKTGRRVAERLTARNLPVRIGSRSGNPAFDWEDRNTWLPALNGVKAAYITYYPDLAIPGATETVEAFARLAVDNGVKRLVLLSGRGEHEAQRADKAFQQSGADWTIVRASWFAQNFSENVMLASILAGELALPVGDVGEPFIDANDIADVVAAALTDDRHIGELYEVTG